MDVRNDTENGSNAGSDSAALWHARLETEDPDDVGVGNGRAPHERRKSLIQNGDILAAAEATTDRQPLVPVGTDDDGSDKSHEVGGDDSSDDLCVRMARYSVTVSQALQSVLKSVTFQQEQLVAVSEALQRRSVSVDSDIKNMYQELAKMRAEVVEKELEISSLREKVEMYRRQLCSDRRRDRDVSTAAEALSVYMTPTWSRPPRMSWNRGSLRKRGRLSMQEYSVLRKESRSLVLDLF